MKNSNDTIGNRTHDLPAPPTAPPRAPLDKPLEDKRSNVIIMMIIIITLPEFGTDAYRCCHVSQVTKASMLVFLKIKLNNICIFLTTLHEKSSKWFKT
jgi:hypothetical protein